MLEFRRGTARALAEEDAALRPLRAVHLLGGRCGNARAEASPNVYRYALEQFRSAPRDALVIEDSVPGVISARGAGTRVIGFTGGGHTFPGHADLLTEAGAETVIRRFADLPAVIAAMAAWEGME